MTVKRTLQEYFLGDDIREFYSEQRAFVPKNIKCQITRSYCLRRVGIDEFGSKTFCYRIPNVLSIVGLVSLNPAVMLVGESLRLAGRIVYRKATEE